MNAWFALVKKDFRLGLPAFIIALLLYGGIIIGGYLLGANLGYIEELLMGALAAVVMLHLFFLLFYLYFSLNSERRRLHLWLHTPMPIAGLLLSKVFTGFVFMTLTYIAAITAAATIATGYHDFFHIGNIFDMIGLASVNIYLTAIYIAGIFLFFWTVYLTLSQRMNDFLSFIVTFILFIIAGMAHDYITHLPFMETLANWGAINWTDVFTAFEFEFSTENIEADLETGEAAFYIGNFVRDIIVTIALFFAACWMLDKKVEV